MMLSGRHVGWLLRGAAGLLVAAAAFGAGAAAPPPDAGHAMAADKQFMIDTAARIVAAGPELSRIWPGFWPQDQAFIIHSRGQGALLVSPGPHPSGFEPLPRDEVPTELKGRVFFHPGTLAGAARPFLPDFPIGGGRTAMLVNAEERNLERTIGLILHEQFHAHQRGAFKGKPAGQFVDPLAIKDRVVFAASAQTEGSILAAALNAASEGERRKHLRSYFALRREREATIPREVAEVERGFERSEGTAEYAERVAHARMFKGSMDALAPMLAEGVGARMGASGPYMTQWFRRRSYSTGATLTYFISRYATGDWRHQIEAGGKLDRMLEALIGAPAPAEAAKLAREARERFGYEERRRALEPAIRAAEKLEIKSVDEFLALAPYQLVVDAAPLGTEARPGFSAQNMTDLGPTTLAIPMAHVFSVTATSMSLTSRRRPVLLQGGEKKYTILLAALPHTAAGPLLPGEHKLERLRIDAEGVDLTIDRPVLVTVAGNKMIVKPLPPA